MAELVRVGIASKELRLEVEGVSDERGERVSKFVVLPISVNVTVVEGLDVAYTEKVGMVETVGIAEEVTLSVCARETV